MDIAEIKREARYKIESMMGLFDFVEDSIKQLQDEKQAKVDIIVALRDLLIGIRQQLRKKGEYELADFIRDALKELGVTIEDEKSE
jgi:cysteinyl-tRNA synthetase